MSRSKKLYILLGVLAAACAATFAVMQMEERKEHIRNSDEIILELSSDSVQSLAWDYDGRSLAFHKDESWLYDEDDAFPVSEEKIHALLEQFESFGAAFVIEDVEDYGQYGLDDPICTIHLATPEQSYDIKLGDYSKMDSQRYVSIGDGNVYLVKHDPLDEFQATIRNLIDHDEVPDFAHTSKITFSDGENYSIMYEEDSTGTYRTEDVYFTQRNGISQPLDTDRIRAYLDNIGYLNLTDYVTYNATEDELRTYGLDDPELTVSVDYTVEREDGEDLSDTFVLHISRDPEEKAAADPDGGSSDEEITAYARIGDSQIVYQISSSGYKKLTDASYDSFRHLEVLPADVADVRQFNISLEGKHYVLNSEQEDGERTWTYQEEELDITGLQSALNALTAEEFTNEKPAQKEEISFTVQLDREDSPEIQISLYRYNGNQCLATVDGQPVALVARSAAVDLIEAIHTIILN